MSEELKEYKIDVHDDAVQMLCNHVRFLSNISIPAARKPRCLLLDAVESLKFMPHRCAVYRTHRTTETYRKLTVGRYQVIFSICEEERTVRVQYILDSRQDNDI